MTEWLQTHETALWWLAGTSVLTFLAGLVLVPIIVTRIPADYFSHRRRHRAPWANQRPVTRGILLVAKNALGLLFVFAGIAMLVLPGQGLLTMMVGIMLLDFPGKYNLERWMVTRRPIFRSLNWLRRRQNREPLRLDH